MLIGIVQGTPGWVWIGLAALAGLGLWQTRPRTMSLLRVSILPLLLIALSLTGVVRAFGPLPIPLTAWAAGVGTALLLGRRGVAVRGARWQPESATLQVPGSWLPLVLILALFAVKYIAGVSLAMHPALVRDAAFVGACSLAYGSFSGLFLARALSLRALAQRRPLLQAA